MRMDLKELENKRVMHIWIILLVRARYFRIIQIENSAENVMQLTEFSIDTSCKLYESRKTGISFKIVDSNFHKGLVLSSKLKRDLKADEDWARIYAICIYYLIKDELNNFNILIICGDEDYTTTRLYLNILFKNNPNYKNKSIHSMNELREVTGKRKLKSYADNMARAYRKRALKSLKRIQEGRQLNPIRVSYKEIKEKWQRIEKLNKVSGE